MLYQAIQAIQQSAHRDLQVVIYSGSKKEPADILKHVEERFALQIASINLHFIKLKSEGTSLRPDNYPSFTMLWQTWASIKVFFEAL